MANDLPGRPIVSRDLKVAAAATVIAIAVIFLGWALLRGLPVRQTERPTASIDESVDPEAAAEIIEKAAAAGEQGQTPETTSPTGDNAPPEEDAEAERQLAEIRRRLEERQRREEELATQADYASLGESLHPLIRPPPFETPSPENSIAEAPAAAVPTETNTTSIEAHPEQSRLLLPGTVIPATLITAIDSGLPGITKAQVVAPVRDSATGTRTLIPANAFLVGSYADSANIGDERLHIYWQAIQFPDGRTVSLDDVPSTDHAGVAGVAGKRRSRFWRTLASAFAINLVTASTARQENSDNRLVSAIKEAAGDTAQTVTERMLERDLNTAPTFRVPAGTRMNVVLERELRLPVWTSS